MGYILTQRGKYAEAEQVLNEALQIERTCFRRRQPAHRGHSKRDLGILYDRQGDLPRAIEATQTAVKIARDRLGSNHYMTGYYLDALANLYLEGQRSADRRSRRPPSAGRLRAGAARRGICMSPPPARLLGEVLLRRGCLAAAEAELRTALDMNVGLAGADSWRTARSEASLGWALIKRDKAAEGEPMLVAARSQTAGDGGPAAPRHTAGNRAGWSSTTARITAMPKPHGFSPRLTSGKLAELSGRHGVRLAMMA